MHCRDHHLKTDSAGLLKAFLERLKDSGLKLTRQRQTLLESAIRLGMPFTADELSTASGHTVDLVTIYRCLAKFVEAGVLVTCDFGSVGDHLARYELAPLDLKHHHHHIICTSCRRVDAVESCKLQGQDKALAKLGYQAVTHKLEFFGICPQCARKKNHRREA